MITLVVTLSLLGAPEEVDQNRIDFFEKRVRPLLVARCYRCHSVEAEEVKGELLLDSREGWRRGGASGPVIVAGDPGASRLIRAVRRVDVELRMPPEEADALAAEEVAVLTRWVRVGAPDPRRGKTSSGRASPRLTSSRRGEASDVEAGRRHWAFRPVGVDVAPRVDDPSWARGTIDLHVLARLEARGLRPAPDCDDTTWIRRVTFLLAGLPPTPSEIDDFMDLPPSRRHEALVDRLLGSPRFGERWGRHWLDVARFAESSGGGRSLMFRNAWRYRDHVIDVYNRDRPFDRFLTDQLAGDLLPHDVAREHNDRLIATGFLALGPTNYELQDKELLRMEVIDEQIDTIGRAFLGLSLGCARCHDHKFDPVSIKDYYALAGIFESTETILPGNVSNYIEQPLEAPETEVYRSHRAAVEKLERELDSRGKAVAKLEDRLEGILVDDPEATLTGTWERSTHTPGFVGDGYIHDNDSDKGARTARFTARIAAAGVYEVRISYTAGGNRAAAVAVRIRHRDGEAIVKVDQRRAPRNGGRFQSLGRFPFAADGVAAVVISNEGTSGHVIADAVQFIPPSGESDELAGLRRGVREHSKEVKRLKAAAPPPPPMTMSVRDEKEPVDTHLRIRGGVRDLGPTVPRGFLRVIDVAGPAIPRERSGRAELARWLTDPRHPLTARVYANRIWQHVLGVGLVATPDDFGFTGSPPTHPELLDYLARRLIDSGWSTKALIREILLSHVAGLSSLDDSQAARVDPDNHLLWRARRRSLEAEAIRDGILAISGRLALDVGGLTIRKLSQYDLGYEFDTRRRSVYVPFFRNTILDIFDVFDIANPNLVTGRRSASTLATQALFLMNSPFVLGEAVAAARQLLARPGLDRGQRLRRACREVLGRPPLERERALAIEYLEGGKARSRSAIESWAGLYQSLFASLDFRYLD